MIDKTTLHKFVDFRSYLPREVGHSQLHDLREEDSTILNGRGNGLLKRSRVLSEFEILEYNGSSTVAIAPAPGITPAAIVPHSSASN